MPENINEIKSKTIKGFFWRFAERISAQLVTFVVSIVLARILMPSDYGVIAIVNIFILIADTLVTSGLGTSLIQKKEADQLDFSTIFYAGLLLAAFFYLILFFSAPLISKLYDQELLIVVLRVMGIRLPVSAINSVQQAYVSRKMIYRKFFFATIIGTIISAIAGITMALNGFGVWALVAQSLINPIIDTIVLFITVRWFPTIEFSFNRFKSLFSFGWKLMVSNLIGTIFNKLRSLIIGAKYSSSDLAYYNRGESFPQLITQNISSSLDSVLFPALAKVQDNLEMVKAASKKALRLQSYVLAPLLFGLAACSDVLIPILLTEKWNDSIIFIKIVCLQEIIDIIGASSLQSIKAVGRSDKILNLEFIKKPIYLIIIFLSIKLNLFCLAFSGVVCAFIAFVVNSIYSKRIINYGFGEQLLDVLPSFIMSLIMGVIVYLFGKININKYLCFILQVLIGVLIYFLLSFISKNNEWKYIKKIITCKIRKN